MTLIIAAVIVIAVIGFIMVMKKNKNIEKQSKSTAGEMIEQKPENDSVQELEAIMNSLLKLNILIRKDRDLQDELRETIENVIDDLIKVTPAMMNRYPGETLTYEIKKIGEKHLYKTVKEFLDLSLESRTHQSVIFEKTIKNLHTISNRSRDIVEKNETAEFKTMATFLAGKFS